MIFYTSTNRLLKCFSASSYWFYAFARVCTSRKIDFRGLGVIIDAGRSLGRWVGCAPWPSVGCQVAAPGASHFAIFRRILGNFGTRQGYDFLDLDKPTVKTFWGYKLLVLCILWGLYQPESIFFRFGDGLRWEIDPSGDLFYSHRNPERVRFDEN